MNFPNYKFRVKGNENKRFIFDIVRKKYVRLTPEEWVRQNCIAFLIQEKKYPLALMGVEKEFYINNLKKRMDIVVFHRNQKPFLLVECKAPQIKINQKIFDQIAIYNLKFNAPLLYVTNGLQHFYAKIDSENQKYIFLKELPFFTNI